MSKFLEDMAQFCREQELNIYFIAAVENGAYDSESIAVNRTNFCSDVYSCAKAFTTTAVGLMVDRGLMSTDEKVCDILGDLCPDGMDARWYDTTVDMVLRHHTGLSGGFLDIDTHDPLTFTDDYLKYMLTAPLVCDPAAESIYTDAAFYLLSRLVEIRAGKNMDDLLREHIYNPLSVREAAFSRCPQGHAMGATGLYIRADDMAKLAALYMYGGEWNGKRILSREWVDTVLTRGYELKSKGDGAAFGKGGMYGQMMMAIPEKNRAVAWEGYNRSKSLEPLVKFAIEY